MTVTLRVPDDLKATLASGGDDIAAQLSLAAAFSLCQRGALSTSQAARLAGLTYADFLQAAATAKVELFPITEDEVAEELSRGFNLGGQRFADHSS